MTRRPIPVALFWGLLLIVLVAAQHRFLSDSQGSLQHLEVINGDGRGYYDYLTSTFIDHDLANQPVNGRYILDVGGRGVNKYFAGTALLMLPFFLLGWAAALLGGFPVDGHSLPFQASMALSAFAYTLLGVYFMRRLFKSFAIDAWVIDVVALTIVLGTNLLYYAALDLTASHVYSFAMIAGWCYFARRAWNDHSQSALLLAALFLAITVLIRPVNALALGFLPFLSGSKSAWNQGLAHWLRRPKSLVLAVAICVGVGFIQLALYRIQSGSWIVWSYADEGFYFLRPAFFDFLFSFKRGWFVYAPFMLWIFYSWWAVGKQKPWLVASHLLPLLLVVYVLSAWWSWHYGGSYGARPMVDFSAPIATMIALGMRGFKQKWKRVVVIATTVLCVGLAVMQVAQIKREIISAWHMNASKWAWSIGKLSPHHAERLGGRNDSPPYHHSKRILFEGHPFDGTAHWSVRKALPDEHGEDLLLLNRDIEFNPSFHYRFEDTSSIYVELSLERYELDSNAASESFVVIELKDGNGELRLYDAFLINDRPDLPTETWKAWHYSYSLPEEVHDGDRLNLYLWNKGRLHFLVRSLRLKMYQME